MGLILGWRLLDHAAHLGGAFFGMWVDLVVQNTFNYLCQDLGLSLKYECANWKFQWRINENIFRRCNIFWKGHWWACLIDGISLMVTSLSGGKENLLWSCGMTCVPADLGQKAGLVAVELMDLDQNETLWGLLDSNSDLCLTLRGQLNALKSYVTFTVFHNNIWGFSNSLTSQFCNSVFSYWHKNNKYIQTSCSEKLGFIIWNPDTIQIHNKHTCWVHMWSFIEK